MICDLCFGTEGPFYNFSINGHEYEHVCEECLKDVIEEFDIPEKREFDYIEKVKED
ncbi:MAG: hypothetical protein ACOC80_12620 [Petrotogales bacterium]